jgi:hypothetical protein
MKKNTKEGDSLESVTISAESKEKYERTWSPENVFDDLIQATILEMVKVNGTNAVVEIDNIASLAGANIEIKISFKSQEDLAVARELVRKARGDGN